MLNSSLTHCIVEQHKSESALKLSLDADFLNLSERKSCIIWQSYLLDYNFQLKDPKASWVNCSIPSLKVTKAKSCLELEFFKLIKKTCSVKWLIFCLSSSICLPNHPKHNSLIKVKLNSTFSHLLNHQEIILIFVPAIPDTRRWQGKRVWFHAMVNQAPSLSSLSFGVYLQGLKLQRQFSYAW